VVEFCAASFAGVGAFLPEGVVFACEGGFGVFVDDCVLFFFGEFVLWLGFFV
jgi:hypothetical protein